MASTLAWTLFSICNSNISLLYLKCQWISLVAPSTSGQPGLCWGAHLCCRVLIREDARVFPAAEEASEQQKRFPEKCKQRMEIYFKGAKTNVKHTCKSVNAAQSYTSHPLHSEFELPPNACYLSAAEKNLWKCFRVFLSSFVGSLNVSTCPKWKLMFSRLPCFVLQTSHFDKTQKWGKMFHQLQSRPACRSSVPGGGSNWAVLWFVWGEHAPNSEATDRWSVDITGSWLSFYRHPLCASSSDSKGVRWRSTFTMSAHISSVSFNLRAAFVWKMSKFCSSCWSWAH